MISYCPCHITVSSHERHGVFNRRQPRLCVPQLVQVDNKKNAPRADDILKFIFLNENCSILIVIPLKFVPQSQINNNPVLIQTKDHDLNVTGGCESNISIKETFVYDGKTRTKNMKKINIDYRKQTRYDRPYSVTSDAAKHKPNA